LYQKYGFTAEAIKTAVRNFLATHKQ
jgi:hypothetical protein